MKKGFVITTTLIIIISSVVVLAGVTTTGVVLYKQDKLEPVIEIKDKFFNFTSDIIYDMVWKNRDEKKILEQELEFSNIKREQAENRADEEATAKVEAQEKAQQEEILKNQAEAKAKQEEYEKKLREQELSEKEAEERKMNADNDNDGLTYREELSLGSSDWSNDSDGDGIKDGEDMHPASGGRNIPQTFSWSYGGYDWNWTANLHEDWVEYYREKPRVDHGVEYVISEDPFIKEVANEIKDGAVSNDVNKTWLAVSFVQNLPYVDDIYTGYDEYPKYPVETFFEKNGDCEDMSYLAASIVDAMNIGSVLIVLPGHMAIGVWMDCDNSGTYYQLNGKCYYYVETTNNTYMAGDIPSEYKNTRATLIEIPSGKRSNVYPTYKKPCESAIDFPGYYYSNGNFYRDSSCNSLITCLPYEDFYYNNNTEKFYWDSSCVQLVVKGCSKSTSYSGYFTNGIEYYYDSSCTNRAKVCRLSSVSYDKYWDGYDFYWDSSCYQKVVAGCSKSAYYPGYFFDGFSYYSDYRCTFKVNPY